MFSREARSPLILRVSPACRRRSTLVVVCEENITALVAAGGGFASKFEVLGIWCRDEGERCFFSEGQQ